MVWSTNLCIFILIFIKNIVFAKGQYLSLSDGDSCEWENVTGKCVDYRRCDTFNVDTKLHNPPPVCAYEKDSVIICCTACLISSMTDALKCDENKKKQEGRTGVKHFDKCVQYFHNLNYACEMPVVWLYAKSLMGKYGGIRCYIDVSRPWDSVFGGIDADRSEFPHMALLGYGENLESAKWLCGGTLISEKYILTAAHCRSTPEFGTVNYVGLGILKRSDPVSLWDRYDVKRFIPHPEYRPPSKYNDIALIETNKIIKFTRSVLPACITTDNIEDLPGVLHNNIKVYATGWGGLGHRQDLANVLQKVELQRFSELECAVQYPPHRNLLAGYNHSTQMCYGDRAKPRDTCGGDSGGPLQLAGHEISCADVVIGVTSYGGTCGFVGVAGIYTRVRDYVPWIEDIVWP